MQEKSYSGLIVQHTETQMLACVEDVINVNVVKVREFDPLTLTLSETVFDYVLSDFVLPDGVNETAKVEAFKEAFKGNAGRDKYAIHTVDFYDLAELLERNADKFAGEKLDYYKYIMKGEMDNITFIKELSSLLVNVGNMCNRLGIK